MDGSTGLILNIQRFSIHDGPGIRTTVFFKGCPLRCWWCHNPESQAAGSELIVSPGRCAGCGACAAACPQGAIDPASPIPDPGRCAACGACVVACCAGARELAGRPMTAAEVMAQVERDVPFYDQSGGGMTASGGEPLAQPDFLLALLRACREAGIATAVDTCGFAPWPVLDRVRPLVDLFLYDLKLADSERHRHFTGVPNDTIVANLRALAAAGQAIALRLPVIPGVNDDADNLARTAALVAALPRPVPLHLLPYHAIALGKYERAGRGYGLPDVQPPGEQRLAEIRDFFARHRIDVRIGG